MLTMPAPAKINLTLEVLGQRPDGFHEIRSVIQTISLSDHLSFQPADRIELNCDLPGWQAEESLVAKTVSLLQKTTGSTQGATIVLNKSIPLLSGLSGDSSDAAATLRGLNQMWGLGLSREKLLELAQQLGSDVTFFLYGGTALVAGRGEIVTPLPPLSHQWIVLTMPPVPRLPGKTKQLYDSLRTNHYTDGQITERLVKELREGKELNPSLLFNTFENVAAAHFPGLSVAQQHFRKIAMADVHLAGSGPTLFTLPKDRTRAEELYLRLKQQSFAPYLAETLARTAPQIL